MVQRYEQGMQRLQRLEQVAAPIVAADGVRQLGIEGVQDAGFEHEAALLGTQPPDDLFGEVGRQVPRMPMQTGD